MSDDKKPAEARKLDQPKMTRSFRKRAPAIRLDPDQLRRQNDLLQSAWRNLNEAASVIAFLNTHHEGLGGQPLHLALDSDEGLSRVETLLGQMTLRA